MFFFCQFYCTGFFCTRVGLTGGKRENPKKGERIITHVGAREQERRRGGATHTDEMWGSVLRGEWRQKRRRH